MIHVGKKNESLPGDAASRDRVAVLLHPQLLKLYELAPAGLKVQASTAIVHPA